MYLCCYFSIQEKMGPQNQPIHHKNSDRPVNLEANRLIYEKSNSYRIHSDNLRWTLLGAYFVFFSAAINQLLANINQKELAVAGLFFILFIVSMAFLLILAVQNWFYNLFAQYVNECEQRLIRNINLRTMQEFSIEKGKDITPFHPAFIFALIVVLLGSCLCFSFSLNSFVLFLSLSNSPLILPVIFILSVVIAFPVFIYLFRHWDKKVYKGFIIKYSNIFKESPKKF
jgi:hypothetical protein